MSGKSNVLFWLEQHGIAPTDDAVQRIYTRAKQSDRCLTDDEILACCKGAKTADSKAS